jgi:glutamyl-tRNA reductase
MTIVNVGLSHRFAPAEMLEKLAVPSAELGDALTRLHAVPSIDEVLACPPATGWRSTRPRQARPNR